MMTTWEVSKHRRVCSASRRPLAVGEEHYSALREGGETFVREDYALEAWEDVDKSAFFSYWRTRVPDEEEKRKRLIIDIEAFYAFFLSLHEAQEAHRQIFRYLAALILVRKRVLRLDDIEKHEEGETLRLFDHRAKAPVTVFAPPATVEELAEAQEALNQIFDCQTGELMV